MKSSLSSYGKMEFCKFQRVVKAIWLFVLVLTLDTISHSFVEGTMKIPKKFRGLEHEGTVKTILDPEDNVVIDCVDFYKQPTLDDPLFENSQVDLSLFPGETKLTNEDLKKAGLFQNWRKYGECPSGTIPIRRIHNRESREKWVKPLIDDHEYAIVKHRRGKYYGGKAELNVWKPKTEPHEISVTQIWVSAGDYQGDKKLNTLEAGWIVYPDRYNDPRPVTFIFWTADAYNKTGCYNFDCKGFVQTFADYALEVPLSPSLYKKPGEQYKLLVEIYQMQNGPYGNWFLKLNGRQIGYWPEKIFSSLKYGAQTVHWGGEIQNRKNFGTHTTTQMGSGHFPGEGYSKASYVQKLAIRNSERIWLDVDEYDLTSLATRSTCYNILVPPPSNEMGTHFYYGGPGYSVDKCKY